MSFISHNVPAGPPLSPRGYTQADFMVTTETYQFYLDKTFYEFRLRQKENKSYKIQIPIVFQYDQTIFDLLDQLKSRFNFSEILFHGNKCVSLNDDSTFFFLNAVNSKSPFEKKNRKYSGDIYGEREKVKEIHDFIQHIKSYGISSIDWHFITRNGSDVATFDLNKNEIFHPEFYPYIDNIYDYFKKFKNSKANVLILLGLPGTGKTSFIRELLTYTNSSAIVTYDEKLMKEDSFYIEFLSSERKFMILEDSDDLLVSREKDSNQIMSKILNSSDGLISVNKKFIFTANILDQKRIDHALLRGGRCFDILNFRPLTYDEAKEVALTINKELPEKDEFTLGEIFNGSEKKVEKIGFSL